MNEAKRQSAEPPLWLTQLREMVEYRAMLRNLIVRDLKVRYKNSILGVLWSLLNPLLMMSVFTLVFSVFRNDQTPAYPVFILVGLLPWNLFQGSVAGGAHIILGNANLVKKIYFPRAILPTASVISQLVNFLISVTVLIILLYVYGLGLTRYALWLPFILLTQLIFTLGLVYFLSSAYVYLRDIGMILDVALSAWFFLTPVIYPLERYTTITLSGFTFNPAVIMRWLNPMASIIDAYRTVLWGTVGPSGAMSGAANMDLGYMGRTFITSIIVFICGFLIFCRLERDFGENL